MHVECFGLDPLCVAHGSGFCLSVGGKAAANLLDSVGFRV